jgi:hypothetical protein
MELRLVRGIGVMLRFQAESIAVLVNTALLACQHVPSRKLPEIKTEYPLVGINFHQAAG